MQEIALSEETRRIASEWDELGESGKLFARKGVVSEEHEVFRLNGRLARALASDIRKALDARDEGWVRAEVLHNRMMLIIFALNGCYGVGGYGDGVCVYYGIRC